LDNISMTQIVRLDITSRQKLILHYNTILGEDANVEIINPYDESNEESFRFPTLKDLSIILYAMMGQGVGWQLADELSQRLGLTDPRLVAETIFDICKEYVEISDEEAMLRYNNAPRFPDIRVKKRTK